MIGPTHFFLLADPTLCNCIVLLRCDTKLGFPSLLHPLHWIVLLRFDILHWNWTALQFKIWETDLCSTWYISPEQTWAQKKCYPLTFQFEAKNEYKRSLPCWTSWSLFGQSRLLHFDMDKQVDTKSDCKWKEAWLNLSLYLYLYIYMYLYMYLY